MKRIFVIFFLVAFVENCYSQNSIIEKYSDSIRLYPNRAKYYLERQYGYYKAGNYEMAVKDCSKAISINPRDKKAYVQRGKSFDELNKHDLAIKDYSIAIGLDSRYYIAYIFRAYSNYDLKKYNLALSDLSNVISSINSKFNKSDYEDLIDAYHARGHVYYALDKYELAIKDFTEVINSGDEYAEIYMDRGDVYFRLKKYELAINDFESALKEEPDNKEAKQYIEKAKFRIYESEDDLVEEQNNENSKKTTEKSKTNTFSIYSDKYYSTIKVLRGQTIDITASGSIVVGAWAGSTTPEGINGYTSYSRVANFKHGSLLVRIGDDGEWDLAGGSKTIVANKSGYLQFMVNDGDPSNNSGSFSVSITIRK